MDDIEEYEEDVALPAGRGEEKYSKFPPEMNITVEENMVALENEEQFSGSAWLTPTTNTLMLVSGFASNLDFHEKEFIHMIEPDIDILHCSSNFGKVTYDGYCFPATKQRSNRGRKPRQPKNKRERQKVGCGDDMNTQVCFWVRRPTSPADGDAVYADAQIFKIKLFRTGDLQLTGSKMETVRDGYHCCLKLIDMLNKVFHKGEPVTVLSPFVPVLKNYTLRVKLPSDQHIVHLINLHRLFAIKQHYDATGKIACTDDLALQEHPSAAPEHPKILYLSYSQQESRLMIAFSTPLPWYPKKKLVMRIFVKGAIIIVGGLKIKDAIDVCEFLQWLIRTNSAKLIVKQNNAYYDDNVAAEYADQFLRPLFEPPKVTRRADVVARHPDAPEWLIDMLMEFWDWQKKYPRLRERIAQLDRGDEPPAGV